MDATTLLTQHKHITIKQTKQHEHHGHCYLSYNPFQENLAEYIFIITYGQIQPRHGQLWLYRPRVLLTISESSRYANPYITMEFNQPLNRLQSHEYHG